MANWSTLKAAIANVIKTNGNQEITGAVLQNTLNSIVSAVGENATFAGIATPTTNPGTPDGPVFYIALELGVYSNFNGITLKNSGFAIIYNTDDNEWAFISYKELNLHSGIKETGTINGIGEDKHAFYWGNTYLKKGYKGRLQFTATGNVKSISCYITTNKGNLSGGYAAIIESYKNLSSNNELIVDFIAQQDGYIMFNTVALSDISISCKIYTDLSSDVDKLSSDVDKLSSDVAELEDNSLTTKNKLFTFGGIANKQPDLGGLQTNWASVIHGVAAQEIETLFVIKSSNSTISSGLIFRLYKGNGATINTAFTELIDTITVTPDEFNQLKSGDIIKLPLSEKIDIGIEDYYTLELEIGTQAVHSLRFGACDAYAAHNLIREGFYKNTTDGNWIIVNTYPEGKYTYGLLWGIYIGEGSSVNFEQSWQEKFYMNILSSLQNYAERLSSDIDKLSSDVAELEDVVIIGLYTLTGNNKESASGPNRAFNFTDLELIKGNKYKFGIEYTNEEEINSISLYTDNVQGTNSYGYVKIGEFNKAKGLPLEIEFIPDVNGYLMFNIGATVNGSVSVTVKQAIQKSDIATDEIEVGTLTGNNDTDYYTNINFSWFKKKLYAGKKYQIRLVQNLISNTANTKFKSLSCYVVYTQGSLNGGYEAVFEGKKSFDNNETIEYTPTKDGYLMLNTYASTDKTFYAYIYLKSIEDFTALQHDIYNLKTRVAELEDVVIIGLYTLTGNNKESASGPNRAFNFTDLELIKGNKYKFGIEYTNEEEINSISLYTDNVQGTNSYGYVKIGEFNKAKGLPLEIEFIPDVNGYLMFNIGATVNGSVSVTVKQAIQKSDIATDEIEVGTLTGNNDTDYYTNINFSWFKKKLYAGKKYQIRLVQNLISNTANTKFKSLSCYVVYTQGSLNGGYEAVFEGKKSFDNNETIEYTPTKDGYLMLNTYASTDKTFYAYIYLKSIEDFTALQHDIYNLKTRVAELEDNEKISTIKQRAKTIIPNSVGKFPIIKPQFKDVYLTLCGDSIFAFQSTFTKDEKGVAAVPPTCDKKANANMLWNALGWGNPQYRRFDYGKKSLVGDWDNTWSDDSQAIFTEIGTFKTEYIGQTRREDPNFAGKIGTNVMQVSTKIDEASFPYQFDKSEDSRWQRNIPKRFSNSANASIKFTIPAGYSKFDFLYHAHTHSDSVTIAVDRGNGIVKVNTIPNDFNGEGAVEANNHVCDLSMENLTEVSGGNDSFGIPNMRLYFNITDTSLPTTITITKSSDTSKYLIYWGITYWGTSDLPYALHINNMAISGYTQQAIYNLRSAMFKFVPCDAIILEMCYNNLANKTFLGQIASMNTNMDNLKTYFESLGKNIGSDIGVWLPHCGQQGYRDYPDTVKCNYSGAEKLAIDKGYNVILNLDKICNDVHDTYYTDMNMPDFMNSLGNNGVHLDIQGQWIYSAAWESLT